MTTDARILVATEVATDAEMVGKLLREEFDSSLSIYPVSGP